MRCCIPYWPYKPKNDDGQNCPEEKEIAQNVRRDRRLFERIESFDARVGENDGEYEVAEKDEQTVARERGE